MKEKLRPSVVSFYTVAGASIFWALAFPLYRTADFVLFGLVMILLFFITWAICPKKVVVQAKKEEPKQLTTGDEQIDILVHEKTLAIEEMHRLNDAISDARISDQIAHIEEVTTKITDYVVDHPDKKRQVNRFFNYYIPTTLKLLNAYDRMDDVGISGVNIDGTKGSVEKMMDTAVSAFDKQLDALYGDEALDISTDITVMENLMKSEGLIK